MAADYSYCADKIKAAWRNFFSSASTSKIRLVVLTTGYDESIFSAYIEAAKAFMGYVSVIGFNIFACPKLIKTYKIRKLPAVLVFKGKSLKEIWMEIEDNPQINRNTAINRIAQLLKLSSLSTATPRALPHRATAPTIVPAADLPSSATGYSSRSAKNKVYDLVNQERTNYNKKLAAAGYQPIPMLRKNEKLEKVAEYHANNMANYGFYSHTDPQGNGVAERLQLLVAKGVIPPINWRAIGENIDKDDMTPESVMRSWMGSPGHAKNILRSNFTDVGIAVDWPTKHWVQVFAQIPH